MIQTILDEGEKTNEDLISIMERRKTAWVIDGTSGTSNKVLFPDNRSDGAWYVETFDEKLRKYLSENYSIEESLKKAVETTAKELGEEMDFPQSVDKVNTLENTITPLDIPAATIALVNWENDSLTCLSLADSGCVIKTNNQIHRVEQGDPSQYDAYVTQLMQDAIEEGEVNTLSEAKNLEKVTRALRNVRIRREVPGGYWCLGVNPLSVEYAQTLEIPMEDVSSALLFTDGFSPLVDTYELFDDWDDTLRFIEENSLQKTVNKIREFENSDEYTSKIEGRKRNDDIGTIHIDFEQNPLH